MKLPKNLKITENIKTVLQILQDEINGNTASAARKLTPGYTMTWAYLGKDDELFHRTKPNIKAELEDVYHIKSRKYDIKNIAETSNIVMVEMVESYPDPKTKKIYRTPLVIVLEMENGKIKKGRHYCDPRLSYMHLTEQQIKKLF
jgi:ketosteroid isomerase-like protein